MPSTYSSRLRLELMATGENPGTWGTTTNTNLGTLLESSIAGRAAVSMTDADYTLTANNGSADEARNMILNISGALTATRNVICPTSSKLYFVRNATTGGQSIIIKTASGSGVTVANGVTVAVFCDGTNVVDAINQFRGVDGSSTAPPLSFASESTLGLYRASAGVLASSGPLQLPANAASALHAVPLQQLTGYQPTFRNRLINGDFSVNQRQVSGTVTLAAGVYGHDRWKAGASGCTYTFATSNGATTLTITAGSLQQVIEDVNVPSGVNTCVMSWSGTAQGKIGGGSYGASGITASVTGGATLTVEFNTGSLSKVQFEQGTIATAFESRHHGAELALCQRYFQNVSGTFTGLASSATAGEISVPIFAVMRVSPTMTNAGNGTYVDGTTAAAITNASLTTGYSFGAQRVGITSTGMTQSRVIVVVGQTLQFSAEL